MTDGEGLEEDLEDLLVGAGIGMHCLNREVNNRGFSHGGVAVCYRESLMNLKPMKLHNPGKYEVLVTTGAIGGYSRKMVVIGCYLPPNYTVGKARKAMDFIAGCITNVKRKLSDPFIVLAGDFNQWKIEEVIADFMDISEAPVGPTRNGRAIDRVFTNFPGHITGAATLPPWNPMISRQRKVTIS